MVSRFSFESLEPVLSKGKKDTQWVEKISMEGFTVTAEKGFRVTEELRNAKGPFVEIAGPTEQRYYFHPIDSKGDVEKIDLFTLPKKKIYISNLLKGHVVYSGDQYAGFSKKVDFRGDAKELPIKERSVGAVYISALGPVGSEVIETLKKGGAEKEIPKSEFTRVEARKDPIAESRALRRNAIKETYRILRNGGFLILQHFPGEYLEFAESIGFKVRHSEYRVRDLYSAVLQKSFSELK